MAQPLGFSLRSTPGDKYHFLHQFPLSARNVFLLIPTCVRKYLCNIVYGKTHLKYYDNHVVLHTEIWGEAHLCSTILVFVCVCVCIVNKKCCNVVCFFGGLLQTGSSLLPAACVRNTERGVSLGAPFCGRHL